MIFLSLQICKIFLFFFLTSFSFPFQGLKWEISTLFNLNLFPGKERSPCVAIKEMGNCLLTCFFFNVIQNNLDVQLKQVIIFISFPCSSRGQTFCLYHHFKGHKVSIDLHFTDMLAQNFKFLSLSQCISSRLVTHHTHCKSLYLACSPSSGTAGDQGPRGLKEAKWLIVQLESQQTTVCHCSPAQHWNRSVYLFQKLGDSYLTRLINVFQCDFPNNIFSSLSAIYSHHGAATLNASDKILLPGKHFLGLSCKQWIWLQFQWIINER